MARVQLIDASQAPLLARPYFADGDPGPIVAALAQVPELLEVAMPFIGAALGPSFIDARTKELVILRTSAVAGCTYCIGSRTVVALDLQLEPSQIRALRGEIAIDEAFTQAPERALLEWTDAVATPGAETSLARDALDDFYTDAEVVELTLVAAATLMLNRFCTALDLPLSAPATERLREAGLS